MQFDRRFLLVAGSILSRRLHSYAELLHQSSRLPTEHMQQTWLFQRVPVPIHLLVPFLFILFRLATASIEYPINQTFELDPDEGINLIKSLLYLDGFSLYRDIWSDQPPLFTVLLAGWLKVFEQTVVAARSLVLGFAALLVWSFYSTLRLRLGVLPACVGTLILINTHSFMRLSVSVMIGIPALALTMLSVYLLCLSLQRQSRHWLVASGVFLALSLQTKLFSIFLIPILFLSLLLDLRSNSQSVTAIRTKLSDALTWLLAVGLTYFILGLLLNSLNYEQIVSSHFGAQYDKTFTQNAAALTKKSYSFLNVIKLTFRQDFLYYILALFSSLEIFRKKRWDGFLPLAWLLVACFLLARHTPVWYHHYLLISIPLSWLCSYGIASLLNLGQQTLRDPASRSSRWQLGRSLMADKPVEAVTASFIAFLIIAAAALEFYSFAQFLRNAANPHAKSGHFKVLELVQQHKSQNRWMFTDRPIYAVYVGQRVPPEIAVLSFKRVLTGSVNHDKMLEILKKYYPEQIVLGRYREQLRVHPAINQYIQQHYVMVYGGDTAEADYFLRKDKLR